MRKAKEKNKPLLSLAAAGLAALLLFGMATAVLAQGTQGKFVADEWSGIAEADIAEGDSTKDQAENQASTTPTPTPVSTQDESTALSDATPESAESSELTENKETDSDSNAEIPAEVSAFSNDLAVEEVSLYDASGTSAQDAVTSWTELKSAVASAANGATIYLSGEITIPLDEVLSVSKNLRLVGTGSAQYTNTVGVGSETVAQGYTYTQNASLRMGDLIDELLKLASVSHRPLHIEHVDVSAMARDILDEAGVKTMDDMRMPVALPACDIVSGDLCVFTNDSGLFSDAGGGWTCLTGNLDLARCITASASYPLVISPTEYLGRTFMDGGCRMNLPTPLFDRSQVDAVVGVGMVKHAQPTSDLSPLSIAKRTMSCGANQLDRIYSQVADIYINLPVSGDDAFQAGTGRQVIAEARQMIVDRPVDWSPAKPTALEAVRRAAVDALSRMVRTHTD